MGIRVNSLIGVAAVLLSTQLAAGEIGFGGAAGFQLKNLEMEQVFTPIGGYSGGGSLSASLPTLNLQGFAYYDAFYFVVKLENTLASQSVDSGIPYTTENTSLQTDVSRQDYSLSIGYKISDSISVFGGYMFGETELTPEPCSLGNNCDNTASRLLESGGGEYQQVYEESGLFGGISYGWNISNGKLNASLGYAFMDGKYYDNFSPGSFNFDGDTTGFSTALSWVAPISNQLAYFIDTRYQQYNMDADGNINSISGLVPSKVETNESMFGVSGGIQMVF